MKVTVKENTVELAPLLKLEIWDYGKFIAIKIASNLSMIKLMERQQLMGTSIFAALMTLIKRTLEFYKALFFIFVR